MQILPSKYCVIKMNSILLGFIVTLYVIKDLAALLGMFKYSKLISSHSKLTSKLDSCLWFLLVTSLMRTLVLTNYHLLGQNLQTLITLTLTHSKSFSPGSMSRKEEHIRRERDAVILYFITSLQKLTSTHLNKLYLHNKDLCLKVLVLLFFKEDKIDNMI